MREWSGLNQRRWTKTGLGWPVAWLQQRKQISGETIGQQVLPARPSRDQRRGAAEVSIW